MLIYKATNLKNGKVYIGETRQTLTRRKNQHFSEAFARNAKDKFHSAIREFGKENFVEVYVSTSLEECERRDVKGLYAKARKGEIKNFTGISAPFEKPLHPDIALDTALLPVEESVHRLLDLILPKVSMKN